MMKNNEQDIWAYNNLEINESDKVVGNAYTREKSGRHILVTVYSYEYEKNREQKMNHVPCIVVENEDGDILSEPHAHQSHNAEKAIENGLETAEDIWKHSIGEL